MKIDLDDKQLSPGIATVTEPATETDWRLLCRQCSNEVTKEAARVVRNGAHRHLLMNPENFVFDVACFADAPGCRVHGTPTDYFSWFPSFAWSFANCRSCGIHLGWRYDGSGGSFFGLIVDRLVS